MLGDVGALGMDTQPGELHVDEAHVEGRVVDDQLGTFDELEEAVGDLGEARLVGDVIIGDAVDRDGALVDLPIRVEVDMEMPPGQAPADDLDPPISMTLWPSVTGMPVVSVSRTTYLIANLLPGYALAACLACRTSSTPRLANWSLARSRGGRSWPRTQRHSTWWR